MFENVEAHVRMANAETTGKNACKFSLFILLLFGLLICLCFAQTWMERIKYHDDKITMNTINNDNEYYSKWYGSSLINYNYSNINNNTCNLPTLIFIRNHKTGGYMKYWEPILMKYCNLYHNIINIMDYNLYKCNISSNASL
eukprot:89429_1